jgi:putative membrane protein
MATLAIVLIAFVAIEHVGFLVLEMFLWNGPIGQKVFRTTPQVASDSRVLAANQGLYNGFLAAGLVYGLLAGNSNVKTALVVFTLSCVIAAGVFGALTVSKRIFFVQALPAALALAAFLV